MKINLKKALDKFYPNNVWLLDNKFMPYSVILSDQKMDELISEIVLDEEISSDSNRPDIAIVFSKDPSEVESGVDVVIVELKGKGLKLAKKEEVVSQLRQRARKLLNYYPNKIQRIWFYGITDIDKEFRVALKDDDFVQLYSEDQLFYKEQRLTVDEEKDIKVPVGLFVLSYDAMLKDAKSRNSTFLNILRDGLREKKTE